MARRSEPMFNAVDIRGLPDEELDDIVGAAGCDPGHSGIWDPGLITITPIVIPPIQP